jgi:autotransporter-associated beta strand protein
MQLVVSLGLSLLVLPGRVALAAPPAGYYHVWSDEFTGSNVNWSVWTQHQPGWRRDAYNTTNALTVSNGVLVITTYTEGGTNFTGMIDTKPSFRQRFGYWESSITYDTSNGMWSSFWLMPATIGNPLGDPATAGTEIDITEHRKVDSANTDISDKTVHNLHWDGYGADHKSVGSGLTANLGLAANYHTYAVRWTDTNYTFFVDGTQTWTTTSAVSRRTERVILSSEVEDNSWAGDIPPGGYGTRANSTVKMLVDYVRYYAPTSVVFWTGGGTTATWTNSANWVAARIPTEDFEVVFGDLTTNRFTCSLGRDFSLRRLTINELDTPLVISNNTLSLNTGGIDMVAVNAGNATILSAITLVAAQTWIVGSNRTLTIRGPVTGTDTLTKSGGGTLTLQGTNSLPALRIGGGGKSAVILAGNSSNTIPAVSVGRITNADFIIQTTATLLTTNLFAGETDGINGDIIHSGGTVTVNGQIRIGHWPNETSTYTLHSGSLILTGTSVSNPFTNVEANGALYLGVDGTGQFTQTGGLVRAEALVLDNRSDTTGTDTYTLTGGTLTLGRWGIQGNPSTHLAFGGGTFSAATNWQTAHPISLTGTNGDTKCDTAGCTITLGGALTGVGGLVKLGLGTLVFAGTNTYTGSTTISNGTLLANLPGGTLTFHGAVTNHATLRATNGTVMEFFAPVINRGVIDAIEGTAIFHAPFINTGSFLDASSVVFNQASISNQALLVQIPSVVGHNYQLQFTASLAPPAWTNAQASQPGTGAVLTFTDPSGATNKTVRYYRIRLVP